MSRAALRGLTFPWSITIVSGMITSRAAAASSRASMSLSRRCGSAEADMASAFAQPGRIGSRVTARASSTLASTELAVGWRTAAVTVRVATSTSQLHASFNPVVQADHDVQRGRAISITSPGALTCSWLSGPSGRAASDRRVRADPAGCRPGEQGREQPVKARP